jgi:hypothetical protein
MNELEELGRTLGTDKQTYHGYTKYYYQHFLPLKNTHLKLLEIGVFHGASVKMWKTFFPHAHIVGVDINAECKRYEDDRISIRIGDQTDKAFLGGLVSEFGGFDIIIDDGGHRMTQQIGSFQTLFPHLKLGGMYIIEDLHTSYLEQFGGGGPDSTVNFLKALIDPLNQENGKSPITSINFYPKICFMQKC